MRPIKKNTATAKVGVALRALRTALKRTQIDFEFSARQTVGRIENESRVASLSKVEDLALELNVHPLVVLTLAYSTALSKRQTADLLQSTWDQLDAIFPDPVEPPPRVAVAVVDEPKSEA